jgi:hypothetical protein
LLNIDLLSTMPALLPWGDANDLAQGTGCRTPSPDDAHAITQEAKDAYSNGTFIADCAIVAPRRAAETSLRARMTAQAASTRWEPVHAA